MSYIPYKEIMHGDKAQYCKLYDREASMQVENALMIGLLEDVLQMVHSYFLQVTKKFSEW